MTKRSILRLPEIDPHDLERLLTGELDDPFSVLGPHRLPDGGDHLVVYLPDGAAVSAITTQTGEVKLQPVPDAPGVFTGDIPSAENYRLKATSKDGHSWDYDDPYRFGPVLGAPSADVTSRTGKDPLWSRLGAHPMQHEGVDGVHFAVWAPNARRVSAVGGFNGWDGRRHMMRRCGGAGLWEIFIPGLREGEAYKYEILGKDGVLQPLKADPVGFGSEHPPENASIVRDLSGYGWRDEEWMSRRHTRNDAAQPISIYEVHLASWQRAPDGRHISYREAAEDLVAYAADMGFTHIELMPMSEHPFDGSWGYQPVGLFAPTVRHGPPHEFRDLIDAAHRQKIGVILDWVPGHFPTDDHGLGQFDGSALYEYADPREGFHQDWNTFIYDYGRPEVANFLIENAHYWLQEFHVDGLRVDAVASMLYRDYSRGPDAWIPNEDGGRENYEAIAMLREMNASTYHTHPGIMTMAEESTSFPGTTTPVSEGGLGFGFKWNMGWMHDTLEYIKVDPRERASHHHEMTFGLTYAFSERFVLPISHDEVVHGKGSLLGRMPGAGDERFANLRAYLGFMWGHPGKKLLFMGQEFGQASEWDHAGTLDWAALETPAHAGVQRLVRDLNTLYRGEPALHAKDADPSGFQWINADDTENCVYSWLRRSGDGGRDVAVLCNFHAKEHSSYKVGLSAEGTWREALNTDADIYGGHGRGNMGAVSAHGHGMHGQPASAEVYLPPLSAIFLVHSG
ncbi:MAG: 1,4-alpha-glucan branching protein GlgB [Pseudomonadota bacterium]